MSARPCPAVERGAATIMAISFLGVILLVGSACALCVALVSDHRRAQSAADLAALAGALAIGRGEDACAQALATARANGADVQQCQVSGREVTVTVLVAGPAWFALSADLQGQARAGPAAP